jgi:hypothetical protein
MRIAIAVITGAVEIASLAAFIFTLIAGVAFATGQF